MQFPTLLLVGLLLAVGSGCKNKQDLAVTAVPDALAPGSAATDPAPPPPVVPPAPEPEQEATDLPKLGGDDVFFAMERTPCYGTCPAYKLIIRPDGSATYEGRRFAPREGRYTGQVDQATMDALKREVEAVDFYALKDVYDQPVTDLPSLIMRLRTDGHDKQVLGRVGAPRPFKDMAIRVEALLANVVWVPVKAEL